MVPGIVEAGALVYVNYGRVEDFQKLRDLGRAVAERILIVRTGRIHPVLHPGADPINILQRIFYAPLIF